VTGTHAVYLTGNYVVPTDKGRSLAYGEDDEDEDDEADDYDFPPDEDQLGLDDIIDEDEESDGLDELENPRITEVESEEEIPKLVNAKGKNKRAAAGSDEEAGLDELIAKDAKSKAATNGDANISKKQQKKLKKNNGEATSVDGRKEAKGVKESPTSSSAPSAKVDKKVQFAKNLELGPLSSLQDKKPAAENSADTLGVKDVQGVKLDDKKLGKGPVAKNGNTVSLRYIGKLEDGKVFDGKSNMDRLSFGRRYD
jgi:FK506-binding nuclear protein